MKIKSSYPRFLLISTAIVLLSACSVADFKQPITDLNTAIDDSISTTPEATKAALATYPDRRNALIVGGFDREQDYTDLADEIIKSSVTTLACLPKTGQRLVEALRARDAKLDIIETDSLELTMSALAHRKDQFDTVILSPAAPSYNQFRDYVERGDKFVELAKAMFSDTSS